MFGVCGNVPVMFSYRQVAGGAIVVPSRYTQWGLRWEIRTPKCLKSFYYYYYTRHYRIDRFRNRLNRSIQVHVLIQLNQNSIRKFVTMFFV